MRGRLSSSGCSNRSMFSMSGSGVSRCRLLQSLSAGLLVVGIGVMSLHCSVTSEVFDLTSWLSLFGESSRKAIMGGVPSAKRSSNCSESQSKGDASTEGKLLHLKQQYRYTLCSASIQDMIACFKEWSGTKLNWNNFSTKVAIQMNDTHPTLCISELMRILMDVEGLPCDTA